VKRTLFLLAVLAPAAALIGILWDSGWARFGATPTLAQRAPRHQPVGLPTSRPTVLSIAEGSGSDLFIRRDATVVIQGETVSFARSFAFAASWQNAGAGVIEAHSPIVVFNASPRNEHDLARLLSIDTAAGGAASGAALDAAFGGHTGIRSNRAMIHGTPDLSQISRVEFAGSVHGVFVDPEVEGSRVRLDTENLVLDFVDNAIVAARTEDAFTITRPDARDLRFSGRGLELLVPQGRARAFRDIRIEVVLPARMSQSGAPVTFVVPGPLDLEMKKPAAGSRGMPSLAGSRLVAGGGVSFEQGDLRGSGAQATLVWDDSAQLSEAELVGDVRILSTLGEARGTRLVLTPRNEKVFLRLEGKPTTLVFDRQAGFVPAQLGSDVTLTTPGTITISPIRDGAKGSKERTIEVGPTVAIAGTTGRVDAARIVATIESADASGLRPLRIAFERLDAHDPEMDLKAESLAVVRTTSQKTVDDVITISRAYDLTYRQKASAKKEPAPAGDPASRRDVPVFGDGAVRIRGDGGVEITRPVLDDRPIVVVARDKFRVDSIDPKTSRPRATLEAKQGRLEAESSGASNTPGVPPSRTVTRFSAEGRVRVELLDRAKALGEKLSYDARTRLVTLVGAGTKDLARVERAGDKPNDWLAAGSIVFQLDLLRFVATQGVNGEMALAPLPWAGTAKNAQPVTTQLLAQRLVASLDADRFAAGEIVPTEVLAEIAVSVIQPGRKLVADSAWFDPVRKSGSFRGSPLRYDVVRDVEGTPLQEGLVAPLVFMESEKVLVEGPADAYLHAKPGFTGLRVADAARGPGSKPAATKPEPLHLRCSGRALLTKEYVRADGRAMMEQGDPNAPSTRASADSVTLFLEKDPAQPKADPDFALAVLEGHARFTSPDFDAASDVMKLNRVTNHVILTNHHDEKLTVIINRQVFGREARNGMAHLDIDLTNPKDPTVTAFDADIEIGPDTRSAPR
jgi:hypothetical protein